MTYSEYLKSLKIENYDKSLLSDKEKIIVDEMLYSNIPFDIIVSAGIDEQKLITYYNNEWCYKEPDKYFYRTWVDWVNCFVKRNDNSKTR